jgi:RNA polymerase sigma-70 factor (ECF subfamily)
LTAAKQTDPQVQRNSERIFDEYLVSSARAGAADAWARLVQRWQPKLLRHAWRCLGDAERAKDAVQDAWVQIWRALASLEDVAAFPAWALRIVTRRCQQLYAHSDRQRVLDAELTLDTVLLAADVQDTEHSADLALVLRALHTLPTAQHTAMALFYLENLSVAEIAIALDTPPGTIKTRLMHARQKIRALLEGASHEQKV